jgi:hypothetical protein
MNLLDRFSAHAALNEAVKTGSATIANSRKGTVLIKHCLGVFKFRVKDENNNLFNTKIYHPCSREYALDYIVNRLY